MENNPDTLVEDTIPNSTSESINYKDLMVEAGKQLGLRKKDILKRVILATWPMMIFLPCFVLSIMYFQTHKSDADITREAPYSAVLVIGAIFAILYGAIIRTIFSTEKRIWIDSFFDQKPLTSQQSWRIARKLFFPSIFFRVNLFLRYYAIVWVVYFGSLTALIVAAVQNIMWPWWLFPLILLGFPIVMWIYSHYYLQARLRFAWFLFVDTYGMTEGSFRNIVSELNKLNKISTTDSFKKALVAEIGSDSAVIITNTTIGLILNGISLANSKVGAIISSVVRVPAEEMASQSADFAKMAANYLLYRKAKELAGEETQFVNEKIYSLALK